MDIAGRLIGPGHPPYIIAEVSCNHGGHMSRALELIDAAKACRADAVKFQAYMADTITLNSARPEFEVADGPWKGRNLHRLYLASQTPFSWFPYIAEHAAKVGITWFASVFDKTSVDLMVQLNAPAIKIASFEITDIPLIEYAAATGKPLIISTGMASDNEIGAACRGAWTDYRGPALLHCVSGYPTLPKEANLDQLRWIAAQHFRDCIGISDHTITNEVAVAATALGAAIIEKHFRLSWHPDTEDSPFSLDEVDFNDMAKSVRNTWDAIQPCRGPTSEASSRPLRRSLFVVADIKAGEVFTRLNVRSIRPGHGLPPVQIDMILGRAAARDIEFGEPMAWSMVR